MEKFKVSFEANNQQLKALGTKHASDTYADIEAEFVLGNRWTDMDSVSAVWWNDFTRVATVLDSQGKCVVPHEVLARKGCVRVNLVGSIVEGDELITRLTSYSAEAVQVNEKIKLTGSETSELTPSQFEQFVTEVKADADRAETVRDEAEAARDVAVSAKDTAVNAVEGFEDIVDTATATAVQTIQGEGATQVTAIQTEGTTQVASVRTEGSTQVTAVQDKGDEVLDSIPADYTQLSQDVTDLKSDLIGITGATPISFTDEKWVSTAGSIGDTLTLEMNDNAAWCCSIINCKENDEFLINVIGGNAPRAYCFVDKDNKIIEVSSPSYTASNLSLIAPREASKLVLNDYSVTPKTSYKDINLELKNVTADISNLIESQYPLLPVHIKEGNFVEDVLYTAPRTFGATNIEKIEYSSIHLDGNVANGLTGNITIPEITFDSTKEYTIKLECESVDLDAPVYIAFSEYGGGDVKKANNTNLTVEISRSSITHFTPYTDYSNVALGLWQGSGSSIPIDHTITLYILEGHLEGPDFKETGWLEEDFNSLKENLAEMANIKDQARATNQFTDVRHKEAQTIGQLVVSPIKYSGIHLEGDVAIGSTGGITKRGITLKAGHTYTLCVVADYDLSLDPIVFAMATIMDDVKDASGRNVIASLAKTNVVVFSPLEDYTGARFSLWQGTDSAIPIDHDFFVFLSEGIYDLSDFGVLTDDIGIQLNDFRRTHIVGDLYVGLPILELTGDVTGMSKDDEVSLKWTYGNDNGDCTMKWQGSSSLNYSKKNYTIKLDNKIDVGWGEQKKYCLKANYIDSTSALNVCSAKLWSQIVANRNTNPAIDVAANNGAMDGFPIIITLNGKFHGLYTLNTPKDKWTFGMGDGEAEYLVTAENHSLSTQFKSTTNLDGTDMELEYAPDDVTLDIVKSSVNTMLNAVINATGAGWESAVGNYLDVGTAIDYMIFSAIMSNIDGIDKNFILSTYDGTKWFLNAYDLDSVLGNDWNGGSYYSPVSSGTSFAGLSNTSRLFHLIYTYSKPTLIARYDALRSGILSETNILNTFYNFCVAIPEPIVSEDNKKWPLKPGTSTKTLSRIMEWYRLHIKVVDDEIDALRN